MASKIYVFESKIWLTLCHVNIKSVNVFCTTKLSCVSLWLKYNISHLSLSLSHFTHTNLNLFEFPPVYHMLNAFLTDLVFSSFVIIRLFGFLRWTVTWNRMWIVTDQCDTKQTPTVDSLCCSPMNRFTINWLWDQKYHYLSSNWEYYLRSCILFGFK